MGTLAFAAQLLTAGSTPAAAPEAGIPAGAWHAAAPPAAMAPARQHASSSAQAGRTEGRVLSARLVTDLGEIGSGILVRVTYRLRVPEGVDRVPLSALEMGGARLGPVRVSGAGEEPREGPDLAPSWEEGDGPALRGSVPLPGGAADSLALELSYRVRGAVEDDDGDLRVRLPVVQVAWPPAEALPGTFRARALLPDSLHVTGTFPTVLGEVQGAGAGSRAYALDLQVVPGVVVVEMTAGDRPLVTFNRGLDLAVVALLLVLGAAGFRALRRGAA